MAKRDLYDTKNLVCFGNGSPKQHNSESYGQKWAPLE
jgi:hypothetical protein